eukprot:CAMPEP_0175060450 /NCGR_PEP_ID=MMETSP0052_2-20121109/13017_1 /TAXON_ID=51329 ORGANISM="Polytomella parva, Strain SAG 63-3" /NCGR_SAMPLE_ID=MMETSP0052_2 /ASSEMBLY_ACC=CAM_ASM_000194 /LENGTH=523 /DNA_ID=CAMNT_0016326157 /DNA_START=36 /DNA_END=1607 /DNA_ORIENTATION=+
MSKHKKSSSILKPTLPNLDKSSESETHSSHGISDSDDNSSEVNGRDKAISDSQNVFDSSEETEVLGRSKAEPKFISRQKKEIKTVASESLKKVDQTYSRNLRSKVNASKASEFLAPTSSRTLESKNKENSSQGSDIRNNRGKGNKKINKPAPSSSSLPSSSSSSLSSSDNENEEDKNDDDEESASPDSEGESSSSGTSSNSEEVSSDESEDESSDDDETKGRRHRSLGGTRKPTQSKPGNQSNKPDGSNKIVDGTSNRNDRVSKEMKNTANMTAENDRVFLRKTRASMDENALSPTKTAPSTSTPPRNNPWTGSKSGSTSVVRNTLASASALSPPTAQMLMAPLPGGSKNGSGGGRSVGGARGGKKASMAAAAAAAALTLKAFHPGPGGVSLFDAVALHATVVPWTPYFASVSEGVDHSSPLSSFGFLRPVNSSPALPSSTAAAAAAAPSAAATGGIFQISTPAQKAAAAWVDSYLRNGGAEKVPATRVLVAFVMKVAGCSEASLEESLQDVGSGGEFHRQEC